MNDSLAAGGAHSAPLASRWWQRFTLWMSSAAHATVSFSLLRIIFGIAMLVVLVPSFPDRHYLWGVGAEWIEPEAKRRGWWEILRIAFPKDNPVVFDLAYGLLIALVLVFIVGWKTRWVTPFLLILWVGLSTNSTLLTNGGDTLMRIVLLFAVFAKLSEHFSVDSWLRRRSSGSGARPPRAPQIPGWVSIWAHNTALILCCYQILLVYLVSSILKLQGEEWMDGTALYYAMVLQEFQIFPELNAAVWHWAPLIHLGTWTALVVQLVFPVALLWKPSRYVAVALITMTHLGIAVLLGLWPFSLAMIGVDLLLIRDSSWERVGRAVRRRLLRSTAPTPHDAPEGADDPVETLAGGPRQHEPVS